MVFHRKHSNFLIVASGGKVMVKVILLIGTLCASVFSTALGDAVALMKPGQFRPLTTPGLTGNMLKTGPVMDVVMAFQNDACWDPLTQQILFIGGPHQAPMRFNVYKAETNMWRSETFPSGSFTSHSYDNLTMDQRGNFYHQYRGTVYVFNTLKNSWQPSLPGISARYGSMEYFPEMDALIYVYNGTIQKMPMSRKSWSTIKTGVPMGGLHNLADYNPIHNVLFFGGGNGSTDFHKLDPNGTITKMASCPVEFRIHGALMTTDPVTGDVLVTDEKDVYAYRVSQNKWERVAQSFVERVGRNVVIPIADYGVVVYFSDGRFPVLLYKHADCPDCVKTGIEKPLLSTVSPVVTVVPNPFSGTGKISIVRNSAQKIKSLRIFSAAGTLVQDYSKELQKGSRTIDLSKFAPGVYFVHWKSDQKTFAKRFIYLN